MLLIIFMSHKNEGRTKKFIYIKKERNSIECSSNNTVKTLSEYKSECNE